MYHYVCMEAGNKRIQLLKETSNNDCYLPFARCAIAMRRLEGLVAAKAQRLFGGDVVRSKVRREPPKFASVARSRTLTHPVRALAKKITPFQDHRKKSLRLLLNDIQRLSREVTRCRGRI